MNEIATTVNTRRKDGIFSKSNAVILVINYNAKGNLNDIAIYFPVGTLGRGLNGPELDYLSVLIFTMTHKKIPPAKFSSDCVDWLDQTAGANHVMHRGELSSTGGGRAISYVIYCVGLGGPTAKVTDGVIKFGISEKFTPR